jgi:hypothetical protein
VYQPHDITWFFLGFLIFLALAGVVLYLKDQKKIGLPRWMAPSLAAMAALQLAGAGITRVWDERQLRNELRNLPRDQIAKLVLSGDGARREISNSHEISAVISLIQGLRYLGAHHSSPRDLIDVVIESGGNSYHYQVGQDSQRPSEYWILERGRAIGSMGREIGRVQSNQLGPLLKQLLEEKP